MTTPNHRPSPGASSSGSTPGAYGSPSTRDVLPTYGAASDQGSAAPGVRRVVLTAVVVALVGAVAASLLVLVSTLAGVASFPRALLLQTPVVFPYARRFSPLVLVAFLLGLVVLAAVVALVTWLGARAASPQRGGAAVLLSVWLGTILGGAFAALLGAPLRLVSYRMPAELLLQQAYSSFGAGAYWGMLFGWVVGLGAAIAFAGGRRGRS